MITHYLLIWSTSGKRYMKLETRELGNQSIGTKEDFLL